MLGETRCEQCLEYECICGNELLEEEDPNLRRLLKESEARTILINQVILFKKTHTETDYQKFKQWKKERIKEDKMQRDSGIECDIDGCTKKATITLQSPQYPDKQLLICRDCFIEIKQSPKNPSEISKARTRICEELESDEGFKWSYVSKIAMLLHDKYGITDYETRNRAAGDILRFLFYE